MPTNTNIKTMMKLNDKQTAAAIIAVGMAFMGMAIRNGIVTFKDRDRTVAVKGLCEREVKADKVTWSLTYTEIGNDPSAMYDLLEQKNRKVVAFLKSAGIKDDEISINPAEIADRQADNYGNEIMNYRYKAKSVITVTSNNIDQVRQLMRRQAELMKQGIAIVSEEYSNNVTYEFTGLNRIKPEMVQEATKTLVPLLRNLQTTPAVSWEIYVVHNKDNSRLRTATTTHRISNVSAWSTPWNMP